MIFDPKLVARAILFAAAHPRRDLGVGGSGILATMLAQAFPRAADAILEKTAEALQTTDQPPPAERVDNLYEPRSGATDSEQTTYVRKHSLWLEAQMRPWLPAAVIGGAMLAAVGALRQRSGRGGN